MMESDTGTRDDKFLKAVAEISKSTDCVTVKVLHKTVVQAG